MTAAHPVAEAGSAIAPGSLAWERHAVAMAALPDRPMIAIVIDDMGLDRANSNRAAALPGPLTLAYMTYADDLAVQVDAGRAAGHEILVHVPMEPLNGYEDPGPNALLTGLDDAEVLRRLRWGLDRATGYVGINNHMGSRFTSTAPGMAIVMAELAARGLIFLDSRTTASTLGLDMARRYNVPYVRRDVFLDNDPLPEKVRNQLVRTEEIARRQGYAVAIGHPRDATLKAMQAWLSDLDRRGFVLVPLSAVIRHRNRAT